MYPVRLLTRKFASDLNSHSENILGHTSIGIADYYTLIILTFKQDSQLLIEKSVHSAERKWDEKRKQAETTITTIREMLKVI